MRTARVIGPRDERCYYHVYNRIAHQAMLLTDSVKDQLLDAIRRVEDFSGVRVLTFAEMTNHLHLLVCVPPREEVDNAELDRRLSRILSRRRMVQIRNRWARWEASGDEGRTLADAERDRYRARMYDLSHFMKTLKELFTEAYNRDTGHWGPLFVPRFSSLYLEPSRKTLLSVASYIDFNPVKGGIVDRPEDYRWCGYSQAVGSERAGIQPNALGRSRLLELLDVITRRGTDPRSGDAEQMLSVYAAALDGRLADVNGAIPPPDGQKPTREEIRRKLDEGRTLSFREHLYCDAAFYIRGKALGSPEFLGRYLAFTGNRDRRYRISRVDGLDVYTLHPLCGEIVPA